MIDWLNVLYNFLWILGLAVLLTAFSLAYWLVGLEARPLRQGLSEPPFRLAIAAGIVLFALGLMLIVTPWWYKIGWIGIIALSAWEGLAAWRDWPGRSKRT
jgi:DMSO/TMAO reductase YedYZ heme-binding membrane subunit